MSKIDPELRKKLLKETKTPFKGLRRLIWAACTGSAFLGIFIMGSKILAGNEIEINNILIQIAACLIFPTLLYFERDRSN